MTDREFFHKISTPDRVQRFYLEPLTHERGFVDKFSYLTSSDVALLLSSFKDQNQNIPGVNTDNIVFISDVPTLPQVMQLLEQHKPLRAGEDLKLVLKIKPNEAFSHKEDPWPLLNAEACPPKHESNIARGLHSTIAYLRHEEGVLKIFLVDAGGGVFFDYRDGFSLFTHTLTKAALKLYSDVKIIKSTAPTQTSWRDCTIFMFDALEFFCRNGATVFADIEPHLVAQNEKIIDRDNSHVFHLKIDHTPAYLLRMTSWAKVSDIPLTYRLPPAYYDNPAFVEANGNTLVSANPRQTLCEYYDEHIEHVYGENKLIKYSTSHAPYGALQKAHTAVYNCMRHTSILNKRDEFNATQYNRFLKKCSSEGLLTQETAEGLRFSSAMEEFILHHHYQLDITTKRHYSGYDPHAVDYSVMMDDLQSMPAHLSTARYIQSMLPAPYTQEYRDRFFSQAYLEEHAQHTRCDSGRTVLWSGGFIPEHPHYYCLGRVSAEAGLVYLNEANARAAQGDEKEEGPLYRTVAMTEVAFPVLNPLWADDYTPYATKKALTPEYIISFARNARGGILSLNVSDTDCDSFFRQNELAVVMQNVHIQSIRVISLDPHTNLPLFKTFTKEDWFEFQNNQWNQSIMTRMELILAELARLKGLEVEPNDGLIQSKMRLVKALMAEVQETLKRVRDIPSLGTVTGAGSKRLGGLSNLHDLRRLANFAKKREFDHRTKLNSILK